MNLKSTLFKVVLGLALTCLIICLALGAAYYRLWLHTFGRYESFGLDVSKDAELTAIFHAHQAVFDKLQHMTADDTLQGQYSSSAGFEGSGLSKSRQQEYQNLVSSISPGLRLYTDYDSSKRFISLRFIFAGGGTTIVAPSWYKGIEYVPGSCETNGRVYANCEINGDTVRLAGRGVVLTNLDQTEALAPNVYLRPIGSNWFLIYTLTD